MAIARHLDGWDRVENFEEAYVGPGVYVLFEGRPQDRDIVYIGKSRSRVMMRVRAHQRDKDFTKVGVILPRRTSELFIHNLEHYVMQEFFDRYGQLPYYNRQHARLKRSGPKFRWHSVARRKSDVSFGGGGRRPRDWGGIEIRTFSDLRGLSDQLVLEDGLTREQSFEEMLPCVRYLYTASTLRNYFYSGVHGNRILPALRDSSPAPAPGSTSLLS